MQYQHRTPRARMKRGIVFSLALAFLIPAPCLAQSLTSDLTAEQILAKVAETYRNLDSFRATVVGWAYVSGSTVPTASYGKWLGGLETEVAESRPGKVRVSNKGFLLVSDGETTWTYLPGQGEYSMVNAAPLLQER